MAKNQYSYEKRKNELKKQKKRQEKLNKKLEKKKMKEEGTMLQDSLDPENMEGVETPQESQDSDEPSATSTE